MISKQEVPDLTRFADMPDEGFELVSEPTRDEEAEKRKIKRQRLSEKQGEKQGE